MIVEKIKDWITAEQQKTGQTFPAAVLATTSPSGAPRSRVIAIKEFKDESLVFFTQKCSRKVADMAQNPNVSLTIWLPADEREVVLEGTASPLSQAENEAYWQAYTRFGQQRFWAYAGTSGQPIASPDVVDDKWKAVQAQYADAQRPIPVSPEYCGFEVIPDRIYFYAYLEDRMSEVVEYVKTAEGWEEQFLSP